MDYLQGLGAVLIGRGIEEGLWLAYAAKGLLPAGIVVGSAAVLAGLLGAAALKRLRAGALAGVPASAGPVLWVLLVATTLATH